LVINNDFLGEHISVAGLITFSDLAAQVKLKPQETLILPQSIFNGEGLTLDGASIQDLKAQFGTKVLLVDQFFESWDWL
jgi:NifB/MoaA-like Fe-S oxidoreductase